MLSQEAECTTSRGYNYKFVDQKIQDNAQFKCQKCSLIPREPVRLKCCDSGLIFCRSCTSSTASIAVCQNCQLKLQWQTDEALQQQISSLQVYCVNREKGCQWTGDLCHVEEHTHKVSGREDTGIQRCQYQLTTCKKCDKEMPYRELNNHDCQHQQVPCEFQFAGCDYVGSRMSMPIHREDSISRHLLLLSKFAKKETYKYTRRERHWIVLCAILSTIMLVLMAALSVSSLLTSTLKDTNGPDIADLQSHLSHIHSKLRGMEKEIERLRADVSQLKSGFFTYIDNKIREFKEYFLSYIPARIR